MKVIFVLFDSLNRHALAAYGGSLPTPNVDRLAARSTVFDRHFIGSMPCMSARRDMHTGRLNFLHRSWGPLEPFDASFQHILKERGTYTHLVSDHYHYFEAGGAELHPGFAYTQGVPVLKIPALKDARRPPLQGGGLADTRNVLFGIDSDFRQTRLLDDAATIGSTQTADRRRDGSPGRPAGAL